MSGPNTTAAEEIRMGVANACLMMPGTAEKRAEEINTLHTLKDREKELVAQAKEEAGVKEHEKRLNKVFGISKKAVKVMEMLDKEKPGDRAAILTQVGVLAMSCGYLDKDLVTLAQEAEASAGQQRDDTGSIFDNTSEGQRRGGADAQPKPVEQKAQPVLQAPTPGLPLDEAERRFEEAKAAAGWKGKGFLPKALKPFKEAVEAARAAQQDGPADLPEAKPGEITAALRESNAVAEEHIRSQVEASKAPAETAAEPAAAKAADLDDELPPPAPKRGANRGLGPDAYH